MLPLIQACDSDRHTPTHTPCSCLSATLELTATFFYIESMLDDTLYTHTAICTVHKLPHLLSITFASLMHPYTPSVRSTHYRLYYTTPILHSNLHLVNRVNSFPQRPSINLSPLRPWHCIAMETSRDHTALPQASVYSETTLHIRYLVYRNSMPAKSFPPLHRFQLFLTLSYTFSRSMN